MDFPFHLYIPFPFLPFLLLSSSFPFLFPYFSLLLPFLSFPFHSFPLPVLFLSFFFPFPFRSFSFPLRYNLPMSHFEKVVFPLRINEFSLPANETCFSHVSSAGSENSLILSAKATMHDVQLSRQVSAPNYVAQVDLKCTSKWFGCKKVFETGLKQVERFQMVPQWVMGGWMDMLSKCCFLRFPSGFKVVSNTCSGALSIPWIWEMTFFWQRKRKERILGTCKEEERKRKGRGKETERKRKGKG